MSLCVSCYAVDVDDEDVEHPRSCGDIKRYYGNAASDDVYTLYLPYGDKKVEVYCDMTTEGGAWTVCICIQK